MKVVIAGGGTGGHLYPGIAVAEKLRKMNIPVLFMVSDRGIDKKILDDCGFRFVEQNMSAFKGEGLLGKMKSLMKLRKAAGVVVPYLDMDDKVLLMGGFAAAPVAFAASKKKCDIYIHEQNSVMGLVNRVMSVEARRIFVSYTPTYKAPTRSQFTGNPVREALRHGDIKNTSERKILVLGGSGGSRAVNAIVASAAKELIEKGYSIRHQTGDKLFDETLAEYEKLGLSGSKSLSLEPYIGEMAGAYREADMVIARSGSGTVFETAYAKRPAVYIPFAKSSDGHQLRNAKVMENNGYAKVIEEKQLSVEKLVQAIEDITAHRIEYNAALAQVTALDSAELIVKGMGIK